jgi:hypothetical protein
MLNSQAQPRTFATVTPSFYIQSPNTNLNHTAHTLTPSFCIQNPITKLTLNKPNKFVSQNSMLNQNPDKTSVPRSPSVCIQTPITNPNTELSKLLRHSTFTFQTQTTIHSCHKHSVSLYPQTLTFSSITSSVSLYAQHSLRLQSQITHN